MSGKPIEKYQIQVYMKARELGLTQVESATIAGFSERSGQRIEAGDHQPNRGRVRDWRTSADPLADVWESELEPMLCAAPQLQPTTLFEVLQERYPVNCFVNILGGLIAYCHQLKKPSIALDHNLLLPA